jgi:ELWxxDGT repeat protein
MKKILLVALTAIVAVASKAQVTQLSSNTSLSFNYSLVNGKALLVSDIDQTLWVTDGTPAGTAQLSPTIRMGPGEAMLNGKLIFAGTTPATGTEIYITDGTAAGTKLLKDVYAGTTSSAPDDGFAVLNGAVYFVAATSAYGRELWKTDGTESGTVMVKDIISGPADSNDPDKFQLFSNGNYLLFAARTPGSGVELYKSDGTESGTSVLMDINPGAPSSDPDYFHMYGNTVLFIAKTGDKGIEIWKTDGTTVQLVKDINPGTGSSMSYGLFYDFNGKVSFIATNGVNGDELWSTDGTTANTNMVKDINPGPGSSSTSLFSAIKMGNKMIFTSSNGPANAELWETDGTEAGTKIFKEIVAGPLGSFPFIFPAFSYTAGSFTTPLFQGNKFFFMARTADKGSELWVSDGTAAGTKMVKDINPDAEDAITAPSYIYTTTALYFTADDGVHGSELWKTDGTEANTVMVADINPDTDPTSSDADIFFGPMVNDKVIFQATNGDNVASDLYAINGSLTPLPVVLGDFNVVGKNADALLTWSTLSEVNTKDFTIQRSTNDATFTTIGSVHAAGNSSKKQLYNYTDKDIASFGDVVYYRIITNDKDGKSTTSKIISLKLKGKNNWSVQLVSNPVRDNLGVMVNGVTGNMNVSIKDISGKTIYNAAAIRANGITSIVTSNLVPGVYVLVSEHNNERQVTRFVKQ